MKIISWLLIVVGCVVFLSGNCFAGQETISLPLPSGYVKVHESSAMGGLASIKEFVPRGQSEDQWTRMVTVQRFNQGAADPVRFLEVMSETWMRSCPGGDVGEIFEDSVSGLPAAFLRTWCPENPVSGHKESVIMACVAGDSAMYLVQASAMIDPDDPEMDEWFDWLSGSLSVCPDGYLIGECPDAR